ncbi:MAG: GAF domain-containing protein [Deltaproteobacteria bacterium]|nr:GAF domain-containing protein [Deltaproteobacteria bacterium]
MIPVMGCSGGSAYLRDGEEMVRVAQVGFSEALLQRTERFPAAERLARPELLQRSPSAVSRAEPGAPGNLLFLASQGLEHLATVPLHDQGKVFGALLLARSEDRAFTSGELALLESIGAQLAIAVQSAQLLRESQQRTAELTLIHEVGRSLVATLELGEVLQAGAENLRRIVDVPHACIALMGPGGEHLRVEAAAGEGAYFRGALVPLEPVEHSLYSRCFHAEEPVVVEDAVHDPRVNQSLRSRSWCTAYVALPLTVRGRTFGVVMLGEKRGPRRFSSAELERITAITNQLAAAAENARLYEDLRQSYDALARAQAQLVQRERLAALGELSAVVAHEVRNPLGVIYNSLATIRRMLPEPAEVSGLLGIVEEEAERLNRMVDDLLDFARPMSPNLVPTPLQRLVMEALPATQAAASGAIQLDLDLAPDLPLVPLDERLIRQVLVNLGVNAVQAMPQGGTLTIRARKREGEVHLELADTGTGITPEAQARIFEPFFTTKAKGTGLGLALVQRIVSWHGGRIEVSSEAGRGATFRLALPLAEPSPAG